MNIMPMNRVQAEEYVHWTYAEPYTFYTIPEEGIEETYKEIVTDPANHYFSVLKDGRLFGIFEYTVSANGFEIGLGICPQEIGKGNGRAFASNCLAFGRKHFNYQGVIKLDVVDFNQRAIHLYKQLEFSETGREARLSFGKTVTFIKMETERTDFVLSYE
ncbi:GNAT family N-acetyltransferase [Sporolactobacillus shoreicorticis]|uniref:GNAT family N-acetyltransferase n=1 Tax=Sporolactobacillus shoreicorticis TaxID=1923877 RepID=A0ABW5S2X5_9BACL|nr:GNAT family N-acetyltransferase [Sporolactobacillus shoreicorticis]MCO7126437.1 GNAT family N-acetyltransferase [Sporolactobacillus shoreicorticis]